MNRVKLYKLGPGARLFGVLLSVWCVVLLPIEIALGQANQNSTPPGAGTQESRPTANREIFVASNGWHSAIFIAKTTIPRNSIPEITDFPKAVFLGFGWGDAAYFPERDPGVLTLLNAALQPTPSVVHVTGLSSHPRDAFPKDEVIRLTLSAEGFRKLLDFLNGAFARVGAGRAAVFAPGLHRYSKFYRAQGEFHLFNNCNSWTARGLAAAGLPLDPDTTFRAESLMASLREIAK
jgi:uncharacterized protein (TIGR02117 family)